MTRLCLLFALSALAGSASAGMRQAGAQPPTRPGDAMTRDSVAAHLVMASIFGQLGFSLARAARDTTTKPWVITIPLGGAAEWSVYRDYLLRIIRARVPTEDDQFVHELSVTGIRMQGDTLVAQFFLGSRWQCYNAWTGGGTSYEMRAVRQANYSFAPRTTAVEYSDGRTCVATPPPRR